MIYKDIKLEDLKVGDLAYVFGEGFGPGSEDMVPILTWCILILEAPEPFSGKSRDMIHLRGINAPIPDYYEPTDADMEKYTHEMIEKWVKDPRFIAQLSFYTDSREDFFKIAEPPNLSPEDKKIIVTKAFNK